MSTLLIVATVLYLLVAGLTAGFSIGMWHFENPDRWPSLRASTLRARKKAARTFRMSLVWPVLLWELVKPVLEAAKTEEDQ